MAEKRILIAMNNEKIWGLILAGGRSKRMGSDKALFVSEGKTQLSIAFSLLKNHVEQVFLSTQADLSHEKERKNFQLIIDTYEDLGPIAGIFSAMDKYKHVSWLVIACDLFNLDDKTISNLLMNRSATYPFTAYKSSYDGLPEPLCAIYASHSRKTMNKMISQGITCPRKILINSNTQLLEQPNTRALDNFNTPEDLKNNISKGGA